MEEVLLLLLNGCRNGRILISTGLLIIIICSNVHGKEINAVVDHHHMLRVVMLCTIVNGIVATTAAAAAVILVGMTFVIVQATRMTVSGNINRRRRLYRTMHPIVLVLRVVDLDAWMLALFLLDEEGWILLFRGIAPSPAGSVVAWTSKTTAT